MKKIIALAVCILIDTVSLFAQSGIPQRIGSEFQVNTYTTDSQAGAHIAMRQNGSFVVVWSSLDQDGDSYGIYGQRYDSTATPIGSEFQVNTHTADWQWSPDVAMDPSGAFVVVWTSTNGQDGDNDGIFGQRYNSSGTPLGSEFQVNSYTTGDQSSPEIAIRSDGSFIVVWQSDGQDGSGEGVYARRFSSSGTPLGSEFQVNTYTSNDQYGQSVAMNSNGRFVVIWHSYLQDGDSYGVYGQRYDSSGTALGSEFQVNTYTTSMQADADVSMKPDGAFLVVWNSYGQDGSSDGLFGQRYDAGGATMGSEFQVNTYTSDRQRDGSGGWNNDGSFVIIWNSNNQDGSDNGVYGQRFNSSGTLKGLEFRVNMTTVNTQTSPEVGLSSTGQFVAAWHSDGQDGSDMGVFGQRFDFYVDAPPLDDRYLLYVPDTLMAGPGSFPGDTISVPVYLDTIHYGKHQGINSFQFAVRYNDSKFHYIGIDTSGSIIGNFGLLSQFAIQAHGELGIGPSFLERDTIFVAAASDDSLFYPSMPPGTPFGYPRILVKLRFMINDSIASLDSTRLRFTQALLNEGKPAVFTKGGSVKIKLRLYGDVDRNGLIVPYDAVLVLRHVIKDTTLAGESLIAAEVTGNGAITAFDAALILQHFVGVITTFPVGDYYKRALPSNRNAGLALEWSGVKDGILTLLVKAKNIQELYGYSMELAFDHTALEFQGASLSEWTQAMISSARSEEGVVRFAAAGAESVDGDGALVHLTFRVLGETADESMIEITQFILNEELIISGSASAGNPNDYSLEQNYPNPFNPTTRIRFNIPETAQVRLTIYNLLGQSVRTLVSDTRAAGSYDIMWDGTNNSGVKLASGVYIYRIQAGKFSETKKLILIK